MCKTYREKLDDPWFDEMDPIKKLMYYESYMADLEEQHAFARSYAIFTGSFTNMDMAQKIISEENADFASTDEELDESTRWVLEGRKEAFKKKKRRRRVVNGAD